MLITTYTQPPEHLTNPKNPIIYIIEYLGVIALPGSAISALIALPRSAITKLN